MIASPPGYRGIEQLYEGTNSLISKAVREKDGRPVILKRLKKPYPLPEDISRFKWEYSTTRNLEIDGVIDALELIVHDNSHTIVLEDFGGRSLAETLKDPDPDPDPDLDQFFEIACCLAEILDQVHRRQVIHKDINPSNIIWNPETGTLKLIDFGISTILPRESLQSLNLNVLEGTLAYMSPEQTGRMNRGLDYRTDLYSLGVTFYEMLTGRLPFREHDPLELVHSHIAKTPKPPHEIRPDVPEMVSRIVMKLMAKTAEERYQSALGLLRDLEACRGQWRDTGDVQAFSTAEQDVFHQLRIPQKLYGRETEIADLMDYFEQAAMGESQMLLIAGYSGIGKTALVNEIRRPITRERGFFSTGKFDQYQRNIPFHGIISSLQAIIRQCLTESDDDIAGWKMKILDQVGQNGQILIDVIPELELIIGAQPPVPDMGATESRNRFGMVFQKFLSVFADATHPLVLFLDDLQWVDAASLDLIRTLITDPDSRHFLLIGAFRDNEVDTAHPLSVCLEEIRKIRPVAEVRLGPLELPHVTQLLSDTVHHTREDCRALAELITAKTGGNPFFINEFLKTLFREALLTLNERGEWQWDLDRIREQDMTENVVDLLAGQIMALHRDTQEVLMLAACIGNELSLETLVMISDQSRADTVGILWQAVESGLLTAPDGFHRVRDLAIHEPAAVRGIDLGWARFRHDRIHQAAYSLISDGLKQAIHVKIGWLMLEHTRDEDMENRLFDITGQLNKGLGLILDKAERLRVARLNIRAGKKAKKATAYTAAVAHFSAAAGLMGETAWQDHYDLMFDTSLCLAEAAYLAGDFARADALYPDILDHAGTRMDRMDKVRAHTVQMTQYHLQGRLADALEAQLSGLALLGLDIPGEDDADLEGFLGAELENVARLLGDRRFDALLSAPEMTDEPARAMMQILSVMWITVYVFGDRPNLMAWVCAKMTGLSLEHGNSELASMAYVNYGLLVSAFMGNYDLGYQAGRMAIDLSERYDNLAIRCQVYCIFYNLVNHWKQPIRENLEQYWKAYEYGMQSGEFCYASYALEFLLLHPFVTGERNLSDLHDEALRFERIIRKISPASLVYSDPLIAQIKNLLGLTTDTASLNWDHFDEAGHTRAHSDNPLIMCWMYIAKLEILYLYGHHDKALELLDQADLMASTRPGQVVIPQIYFYTAMNLARCWLDAGVDDRKRYLGIIDTYQEKMKAWSDACKANHTHKYLLVEAEKAVIQGRDERAADLFDAAIESASDNGFINNAALANEAAARFWLKKGKEKFAELYLTEAWHLFRQWGAVAKVADLEKRHPRLLSRTVSRTGTVRAPVLSTITATTTVEHQVALDLNSVMKASQAISGEIVFKKLLEKMVGIVIENAGAQKGMIMMEMGGDLTIVASGHIDAPRVDVLEAEPVDTSDKLPVSLVKYVARTKESVVLDDAAARSANQPAAHNDFSSDPYIRQYRPKSVLCTPVLHKGVLSSVLYLENNLTTGAFTPDRLALLRILSSQTAISLENARLYRDLDRYSQTLEERVTERTEKLHQILKRLEITNRRITDSIAYARRIQKSLLPDAARVGRILGPHFILWKPRDMVGGDIYSVDRTDTGFLVTVMDCTGHGVPGAFMSMIASSLLKRLIRSVDPLDPAELLMQLNRGGRASLRHDRDDAISDDGLDAGICFVDRDRQTLTFAGARLSLVYLAGNEVIRVKGDRQSLGYQSSDPDYVYTNHEIDLAAGMRFYLFTDGYTDQMGAEKKIRFGTRRFMDLLKDSRDVSLQSQGKRLTDAFHAHRGSRIVQDDLTVIGFSAD